MHRNAESKLRILTLQFIKMKMSSTAAADNILNVFVLVWNFMIRFYAWKGRENRKRLKCWEKSLKYF